MTESRIGGPGHTSPAETPLRVAALERKLGALEWWKVTGEIVTVVLADSVLCGGCGHHHWLFICRDGRTRCHDCDAQDIRARVVL